MIFKPLFLDSFKCIADKCTDNCCQGWDICVDDDTADFYRSLGGEVGELVRSRIDVVDGDMLLCREGGRCGFLDDDGLCLLIKQLGDGALCDICREHPRFYSYSHDGGICIAGVGLCCEAAAALWLDTPLGFVVEADEYEATYDELAELDELKRLISELQNTAVPLAERFDRILSTEPCEGNVELYFELRRLYASLEALSDDYPARFSAEIPTVGKSEEYYYAALAVYFVFRYFYEITDRELLIKFAAANIIMISSMSGELLLAAKDFSKEVEYDSDNVSRVLDFLTGVDKMQLTELMHSIFSKNCLDKH